MEELALKIDHVSKQYRLGAIGGGTLRGDLQSWWARKHGQVDPNSKIGDRTDINVGERFLALDDINLEVKKGEALGIIGHNGAGKSTLLKLLSRVTAPTEGKISINGRIASMLEVGTGFHPEMTGRENVYLNGAILGMTRAEIDRKFDEIVEFSEVAKFIDTPVKRYSSGMYVKLAFSVAAHLDSEIMIMDEVLAVGDMKFQKKCLDKMRSAAKDEGRTVLYVSHNMNTIRTLCDRCIVMDHGKIIFSGDVEEAIICYLGVKQDLRTTYEYTQRRVGYDLDEAMHFDKLQFLNVETPIFDYKNPIDLAITFTAKQAMENMSFRMVIQTEDMRGVGLTTTSSSINTHAGVNEITLRFLPETLAPGKYTVKLIAYSINEYGNGPLHDVIENAFSFEILSEVNGNNYMTWNPSVWGYIQFPQLEVLQ